MPRRTFRYQPGRSVNLRVTQVLDTPTAQANVYRKESGRSFTYEQTIELLRQELEKMPPNTVFVVRAKGGTAAYPERWWSSPPILASEFEELEDDEIETILYDLQEVGPTALDLYTRKD